jgi:hypothetical protein
MTYEVASAWFFVLSWLIVMDFSWNITWYPCGSSMATNVAYELAHQGIDLPRLQYCTNTLLFRYPICRYHITKALFHQGINPLDPQRFNTVLSCNIWYLIYIGPQSFDIYPLISKDQWSWFNWILVHSFPRQKLLSHARFCDLLGFIQTM